MDGSLDTALKALEIITVGGAAAAVFYKLGATTEKFENIGKLQAAEISALKINAEKVAQGQERIGDLITKVALQQQRLDNQSERQTAHEARTDQRFGLLERRFDELRHGEGYITAKGAAG